MTTAPPLLHGDDCSTPITIPATADAAASSSPCLPQHEQTEECLLRMLEAEDSVVSHLHATAHASSKEPAAHLTVWRERVAQWAYTVVDHVQADRAAVYNVLLLLDSYLDAITATTSSSIVAADEIDAPTYQLLAMSCLYLVLRLRDSRALSVEQLVSMSRNDGSNGSNSAVGVVTPRRVARTMKSILTALSTSWRSLLAAPAPGEFVAAYVQQLQQARQASFPAATATTTGSTAGAHTKLDDLLSATRWSALLDDATYLAELSVCDTYLRRERPSVVAYAALLNVLTSEQQQTATATTGLRRDLQSLQVLTGHVSDAVPGDTVRGVAARLGYVRSQSVDAATAAAGTCEADREPAVVVPQEVEVEVEVVPTTVTPATVTPTSGVKRRIVSYEDVSAVVDAALPVGSSGSGSQGGGMKRVRGHTGDLAELLQRSSDLASFSSAGDSEEDDAATAAANANNKNENTTKRARLVAAAAAT